MLFQNKVAVEWGIFLTSDPTSYFMRTVQEGVSVKNRGNETLISHVT